MAKVKGRRFDAFDKPIKPVRPASETESVLHSTIVARDEEDGKNQDSSPVEVVGGKDKRWKIW